MESTLLSIKILEIFKSKKDCKEISVKEKDCILIMIQC